jgi:hypothetical protein
MNKKPDKKPYEPPAVKKVKLEIKNAVLSVCHSSTNLDPDYGSGCSINTGGCYN